MTEATATLPPRSVHRIEVWALQDHVDPAADALLPQACQHCGHIDSLRVARVFLIDAPLDEQQADRVAGDLLTDPINQQARRGTSKPLARSTIVEVHYKPGVMDPVAQSTREAIVEMLPHLDLDDVEVRTGLRCDLIGPDANAQRAEQFARAVLANPVIQDIHLQPFAPTQFPHGSPYQLRIRHMPIRDLDDDALTKMSREAHLFLSVDEMRAIRDYYRQIGREPADIELETLAQTWSEHCVHKTLKSTITYRGEIDPIDFAHRPGHTVNLDGSVTIHNLLKSTIAAATQKLMEDRELGQWCVSVFKDNAGIVRFDDEDSIAIKVETHNHPSAIEPYGGAATGIGGCIRDVMGTGLSARPIANTDIFCVAPASTKDLPKGVIPPDRILRQVVAGVRDYGNRMGIPTINGAVYFDGDYLGNPLVFAGCVGIIPLKYAFGAAKPGDRIIALGGRTGRDGIHGATFSSAELTDSHADEFSHAVQIGNAITQKKMMDVILQARDQKDGPLFNAITDCGAGGFSSAIGEMGGQIGARVTLETAPLKYEGLSYTEIWISEAQERMVLALPPKNVARLRELCEAEDVEMCDLGEFGITDKNGEAELILTYRGTEVGRMSMHFLHEGIPTPTRQAEWREERRAKSEERQKLDASPPSLLSLRSSLLALLAHPNIASKHWIIRQYDHEVQGGSVVKPLVGPLQLGPSDAAVIRPKLNSQRGIAIGSGLQPGISEKTAPRFADEGDSYWMALAAIDEAVRNLVCVGADPSRIALLDNFCWPRCEDPKQLGSLVRAAEACYDGALAYRTPFVSGKDSLNNQFTMEDGRVITIPPTLLITALGIVPDVARCVTMDAKAPGNLLLLVGQTTSAMGGSHYVRVTGDRNVDLTIPRVDLDAHPRTARAVANLIVHGLVRSAHDCSDGGLLVAAAEMAFAGNVGLDLNLRPLLTSELNEAAICFAETPGRYLLEIERSQVNSVQVKLRDARITHALIGGFAHHGNLTIENKTSVPLNDLRGAWRGTLDW